jgi:hypothetical protein
LARFTAALVSKYLLKAMLVAGSPGDVTVRLTEHLIAFLLLLAACEMPTAARFIMTVKGKVAHVIR